MNNFWKTFLAALCGTIAAFIVFGFMFFALIGSLASLTQKTEPTVPSSAILKIDLSQPIGERSQDDPMSGFNPMSFNFNISDAPTVGVYDAVRAIKKAADDPAIKFIYITNNMTTNAGISNLEELRDALVEFHNSGKAIIAYGVNFTQGGYYISSAADKVYVNDVSMSPIVGIGTNMMFFKDLLDKLGVQVQLVRHGKYKSAAEQYILSNISKENMAQQEEMMKSVWSTWVNAICKSREITPEAFNEAVNNLKLGDAKSLVANKLADSIVTNNQMTQNLCVLFGVKKPEDLKYISLYKYAKAVVKPEGKSSDKIAVLYADGEITMDAQDGIAAKRICPVIQKIAKDKNVKAVVFRVNSPGGDAQAAELIREEIQALRKSKPVICSYGDYAASGGYWISAQTDRIFTDRTTLTGSIGVFTLSFNYGKGLKEHLKINTATIATNAHSTMGQGIAPLDEAEVAYYQKFVENIYTQFTGIAADGRKLPVSYIDSIGQGRVWTGAQGLENKLVDEIGGIDKAVAYAAKVAKLKDYRVYEYPAVKTSLEKLMESFSGDADAKAAISSLSDPEKLLEKTYSSLSKFKGVKSYARMPYIYEFSY